MKLFIQDIKIGYHSFRREWFKRKCFSIQDTTGRFHHELVYMNHSYKKAYESFVEARTSLRLLMVQTAS